jgi:23S rRNA (cytosine1962-C5)-methyltransferase
VQTLREELQPPGIVERVEARIRELEQLPPLASALLWGEKSSTEVTMNGVRFHHDGLEGQKTGAFLDQRENYLAAARYAHGEALDAFCYQGGFALHMALHPAAKCSRVTGVDSSRPALEMAEKNAALNGRDLEWIEANAFDLLREYAASNRRYDTIVLDPPAFAKSKRDLEKALGGYKELNLRAMKMLRPGGILVTCSCSFHVSAAEFMGVVAAAARDSHKDLRVVESRGASKDHPILLNVPETSYLQCLIFTVSD